MRSNQRDLQDVWFCKAGTSISGIDTVKTYTKPEKHEFSVSATSGLVLSFGAGLAPSYDRYITSYDRDFEPEEGMMVFVDVVPKLDKDGNLVQSETDFGVLQYATEPDYIVDKIYDTERGNVARYGLKKV